MHFQGARVARFSNSMDMSFSKLQEVVKDREASRAAVHGAAESERPEQQQVKGGATKKPPEARLKDQRRSSRSGDHHLRPCTHLSLVSNPALERLL